MAGLDSSMMSGVRQSLDLFNDSRREFAVKVTVDFLRHFKGASAMTADGDGCGKVNLASVDC